MVSGKMPICCISPVLGGGIFHWRINAMIRRIKGRVICLAHVALGILACKIHKLNVTGFHHQYHPPVLTP